MLKIRNTWLKKGRPRVQKEELDFSSNKCLMTYRGGRVSMMDPRSNLSPTTLGTASNNTRTKTIGVILVRCSGLKRARASRIRAKVSPKVRAKVRSGKVKADMIIQRTPGETKIGILQIVEQKSHHGCRGRTSQRFRTRGPVSRWHGPRDRSFPQALRFRRQDGLLLRMEEALHRCCQRCPLQLDRNPL